jgi:AcrR family transcriptional regulator
VNAAAQRRLERRDEIIQAFWRVARANPRRSINVRAVAAEAEMSPANVLHYFSTLDELQMTAMRGAMEQFAEQRQAILDLPESATARIFAMIEAGVPDRISDELRQVYESVALLSEYPEYRPVHRALTERQIMLYRALIEIGAGTGEFTLASPPGMIARNLVALEDAYDLYPLAGDPTPREECRASVRSYAELALGLEPGAGLAAR